jgi:hypothetical protein
VCGDGDGMGDLLGNLHWNTTVWGEDGRSPWKRNREFSMKFDKLVRDAFAKAAFGSLLPTKEAAKKFLDTKRLYLPFIPVLLGGDDLWLVGEKEAVLEICQKFIKEYETLAGDNSEFPILVRALNVAQPRLDKKRSDAAAKLEKTPEPQPPLRFTISLGVAFAKDSHPAHDMVLIAESLMKSAKKLRKGEVPKTRKAPDPYKGCLDWHWVESSKSEEIKEARSKGWMYNGSSGETMLLTTRPWTHEEATQFQEAAETFQKVPRRKREQLEEILRLGKTLGDLAWKSWWEGLKKGERQWVSSAVALLGVWSPKVDDTPWKDNLGKAKCMLNNQEVEVDVYATPFIDLLALQHVLGLEGAGGKKTHTDSSGSQQGGQS